LLVNGKEFVEDFGNYTIRMGDGEKKFKKASFYGRRKSVG
jgi:hypothetical protein